jgi:predicted cupin superfamily sugar epimerase
MSLSADEIKAMLQLSPHPTCGFVRESYRSSQLVPATGLPSSFDGVRPLGSVLYFLVTPDAHIAMHRIRSDQMYHHYLGDPLEVLLLYADGSGAVQTVGPDLAAGMQPQLFIPGGTFHISRVRPGGAYALLGTTEWPGVAAEDVEQGDYERLVTAYPAYHEQIIAFMKHTVATASGGTN